MRGPEFLPGNKGCADVHSDQSTCGAHLTAPLSAPSISFKKSVDFIGGESTPGIFLPPSLFWGSLSDQFSLSFPSPPS